LGALLAAFAAGPASAAKKVALVVGNANYAEAPLRNPVNDARAVARQLRGKGFEVLLRENVTKAQFSEAVADFGEKLAAGDTALFFFAGHGIQVQGRNYLLPVDARITSEQRVRLEAMDVEAVLDQTTAARAAVSMMILDADPRARGHVDRLRDRPGEGGGRRRGIERPLHPGLAPRARRAGVEGRGSVQAGADRSRARLGRHASSVGGFVADRGFLLPATGRADGRARGDFLGFDQGHDGPRGVDRVFEPLSERTFRADRARSPDAERALQAADAFRSQSSRQVASVAGAVPRVFAPINGQFFANIGGGVLGPVGLQSFMTFEDGVFRLTTTFHNSSQGTLTLIRCLGVGVVGADRAIAPVTMDCHTSGSVESHTISGRVVEVDGRPRVEMTFENARGRKHEVVYR
jgi:hypothetical protein